MRSHYALTAVVMLALRSLAAGQATPSTVAATTQHFELHSDPWINLHHFLYQWARQDLAMSAGRKPVIVAERSSLDQLSNEVRTTWVRSVAFYRDSVAARSHWDLDMLRLKRDLVGLSGAARARPSDRISGIAEALIAAMPIYRERWWPSHDAANRAWADSVAPYLRRHEKDFVQMTARVHDAKWPAERWRVDLSAYANGAGGYTTREGHVVIYSTDAGIQDLHMLELVLHEIQHAEVILAQTPEALDQAFQNVGAKPPDNLWHALIFATAGEFVRSISAGEGRPRYVPYWIAEGFETFDGWKNLVPAVNQHWLPVVRGEMTREEGLKSLAQALK